MKPSLTPILHFQTMNPPEFPRVAGYHGEVVHNRDGSDLQIQWTNHASPLLKIMPDGSILFRALIIEWERKKTIQRACNSFSSRLGVHIFLRSMHEFGSNRRTSGQIHHTGLSEPVNQSGVPSFENLDPDIAVEQVAHHQVFAGGKGRSSGISNSLSAQHPMISANSGIRRFISSKVGGSFSFSTSEIASRTRDTRTRTFSGARRSRVRSSSNAIVVTGRHCHCATKNSTSHFQTP